MKSLDLYVGPARGGVIHRRYLAGDIAPFFDYPDYGAASSFRLKAEEVDRRFDREARLRAAGALASAALTPRLSEWVERRGYMVTTGQQPALFGGPLYCVVKALGAVRLAQRLEAELDRPVIPVYWMASDDHDWAEADHVALTSPKNELHQIRLAPPAVAGRPSLGRVALGSEIERCVGELRSLLPPSEFAEGCLASVEEAFVPGTTLPRACLQLLGGWLSRFGLFFVDAASAEVKEGSADVLRAELERASESEALLQATASKLAELELPLQVPILEGAVNLFLEGSLGRERLYRERAGFRLRGSGAHLSKDEVLGSRRDDPSSLSPNVLLRPVVESALFPTLAYVAGPGEVAYFAQMRSYFASHGSTMPVVYPRMGVTPVEAKVAKVLSKFDLAIGSLERPLHEVTTSFARDSVPDEIQNRIAELRAKAGLALSELEMAVKSIDPTLAGSLRHARTQVFEAVAELERKITLAVKRENAIAISQIEKAAIHLFPGGVPVERVQSPLYYLARYGEAFLDELHASLEVELT